jgi:hypothetical protein
MLDDTIEIEEMMREVFEQMRRDIIARHEQAGQVASGRTRDSLRSEIVPGMSSVTATLYGRKYFAALETGTKPWAKQYQHPPKPFVETIAEWMKDKGITGVSAYLVARKIMQEGSSLYRSGGRNDIFTPAMQDAERKIGEQISALFERITLETIAMI